MCRYGMYTPSRMLLVIALVMFARPVVAEIRYGLIDLTSLSAPSQFPASLSINNAGQVAGPGGIWTVGVGIKPLPFSPSGINDLGQVSGTDFTDAFLWTPDPTPADSGTVQNLGQGYATGLNSTGTVVGYTDGIQDGFRPWQWTAQTGRESLVFENDFESATAIDVNNAGTVVGVNPAGPVSYLWTAGSNVAQTIPYEGPGAYPYDINNLGQLAGNGPNSISSLYTPGAGYRDLGQLNGTPGWAMAVNDEGQVVGIATRDLDDDRGTAWIWTDAEGIVDLNTLIAPQGADGWFLRQPWGINNAGQIVGTGRLGSDESRVFLLNPVPEPSTFWTAVVAMTLAAYFRRRWRVPVSAP